MTKQNEDVGMGKKGHVQYAQVGVILPCAHPCKPGQSYPCQPRNLCKSLPRTFRILLSAPGRTKSPVLCSTSSLRVCARLLILVGGDVNGIVW
jgi:hypothetical protein